MTVSAESMALLERTKQVRIETRSDGKAIETIIWIVVADGKIYVRSVRGESGRWHRRALENPEVRIHVDGEAIDFRAVPVEHEAEIVAVTRALRDKYPPGDSLDRMTRDEVLGTTLRLDPVP